MYSGIFSRISNFQNFAERIIADSINVTPNVHNYLKIFVHKIFEVGGSSLKNANILRLENLSYTVTGTGYMSIISMVSFMTLSIYMYIKLLYYTPVHQASHTTVINLSSLLESFALSCISHSWI